MTNHSDGYQLHTPIFWGAPLMYSRIVGYFLAGELWKEQSPRTNLSDWGHTHTTHKTHVFDSFNTSLHLLLWLALHVTLVYIVV